MKLIYSGVSLMFFVFTLFLIFFPVKSQLNLSGTYKTEFKEKEKIISYVYFVKGNYFEISKVIENKLYTRCNGEFSVKGDLIILKKQKCSYVQGKEFKKVIAINDTQYKVRNIMADSFEMTMPEKNSIDYKDRWLQFRK